MAPLRHAEIAARDAALRFVGRLSVFDVGVDGRGSPKVVFRLLRDSPQARAVLSAWAAEARVDISIIPATR
jgi:hypothetical protein